MKSFLDCKSIQKDRKGPGVVIIAQKVLWRKLFRLCISYIEIYHEKYPPPSTCEYPSQEALPLHEIRLGVSP